MGMEVRRFFEIFSLGGCQSPLLVRVSDLSIHPHRESLAKEGLSWSNHFSHLNVVPTPSICTVKSKKRSSSGIRSMLNFGSGKISMVSTTDEVTSPDQN